MTTENTADNQERRADPQDRVQALVIQSASNKCKLSCNGCKYNWYSAPHGQTRNRAPHSRCMKLNADIPMIVQDYSGGHRKWVGSEIPADCPVHMQQDLFG